MRLYQKTYQGLNSGFVILSMKRWNLKIHFTTVKQRKDIKMTKNIKILLNYEMKYDKIHI